MNTLLKLMKKRALGYILSALAMLAAITLDMFNPYLVGNIVDKVILNGNISYLKMALLCLAFITIGRALLGYLKEYGFDLTSSKIILDLRKNIFDHIQKLSFSFFDKYNTGELMSRIKDDTDNIMHALCFGIMLLLEQGIYFIIASVILFTLNWKLALISLVTMPIIEFVVFRLEKKIGATYEKISDQRAVLNTTAQQNLTGVRLVKAFGREKYEIEKFLDQNQENYRINVDQVKIMADHNPVIEFLSNVVVVLVISFGGHFVIGGELTLGELVAFSNYIYMLIWPMRMMGWLTNVLAQCLASVKKIDKIFAEEPTIKNPEHPITPDILEGRVEFRKVDFSIGDASILKDINIDAKPGSTVAIMGITGAGKSSLINLIGRYYDCTSGGIYFDGVNVKNMDMFLLRKNTAVVMQDVFLFSDTIEENIKFGLELSSDDPVFTSAVKDSMVDEFVFQMNEGYKTVIGERGIGLSGGQKQRISIARALVRDAKVLILDDSTSALDMETEYEIQKALNKRKGITKFIIAHRISAVKNADEILYFENGSIIERGTHEKLLALRGRYYKTYCAQYSDYAEEFIKEVSNAG